MLPTIALRLQLGNLLANDTTTLNQAVNANHVTLIMAPFVPSENLLPASLTVATFNGSTDINVPVGAMEVGVDPVTGQQVITITPPAGGWRWITGSSLNLPQTIYGFALFDKLHANLWGTALLPVPVTLSAAGQAVDLGKITINFTLQPMS